ncbi:MAG: hypothetical protein Q8K75_02790 [Chlamydiales bacterium]|nr:hypothetical protein [Chlamydiales bacterium]
MNVSSSEKVSFNWSSITPSQILEASNDFLSFTEVQTSVTPRPTSEITVMDLTHNNQFNYNNVCLFDQGREGIEKNFNVFLEEYARTENPVEIQEIHTSIKGLGNHNLGELIQTIASPKVAIQKNITKHWILSDNQYRIDQLSEILRENETRTKGVIRECFASKFGITVETAQRFFVSMMNETKNSVAKVMRDFVNRPSESTAYSLERYPHLAPVVSKESVEIDDLTGIDPENGPFKNLNGTYIIDSDKLTLYSNLLCELLKNNPGKSTIQIRHLFALYVKYTDGSVKDVVTKLLKESNLNVCLRPMMAHYIKVDGLAAYNRYIRTHEHLRGL